MALPAGGGVPAAVVLTAPARAASAGLFSYCSGVSGARQMSDAESAVDALLETLI
jgi:hypothetical protein